MCRGRCSRHSRRRRWSTGSWLEGEGVSAHTTHENEMRDVFLVFDAEMVVRWEKIGNGTLRKNVALELSRHTAAS